MQTFSTHNYNSFGMLMPNRHEQENMYEYGFNGMRKDDEIKGVSGSSYDFGSRIYDPRVGRWLSTDPLGGRQPDQSTYKAFLNNPIYWVDPDGKTEYETIVVKDERTGQSLRVYKSISAKQMTDGVNQGYFKQYYYDYAHVTTYTIKQDGSVVESYATEILFENGIKYTDPEVLDYIMGCEGQARDVRDPGDKFVQAGGFYMTGKNGQGTKYHSKDPDYVGNVDDMIELLSKYKAKGKFTMKNPKKANPEDDSGSFDMLETLMNEMKRAGDKVSTIKSLKKKIEDAVESSSNSNEIPGNNKTMSNKLYPDPTRGKDAIERYPATPSERMNGDTLNGKSDKIMPKPKGENKGD